MFAIALNAYREAIRDRVLFAVIGLSAASLVFGSSLAWLSISEQVRILVDHGVVTLSWVSNLVAIFLGASFLYKEIELRTLYVILAKPVPRWQFIVGKYFGILATTVVFIAITASMLLVLLDLQAAEAAGRPGAGFAWVYNQILSSRLARVLLFLLVAVAVLTATRAARRLPFVERLRDELGGAVTAVFSLILLAATAMLARPVAPEETRYILLAAVLVAGEVVITAAIAMLFSSFSTPFVTGILTFGLFLVGRSVGAMLELKGRQVPTEIRELLHSLAVVLPNLQLFVPSRHALAPTERGIGVASFLASALGYSVMYATLLLFLAAWVFRKRDLV